MASHTVHHTRVRATDKWAGIGIDLRYGMRSLTEFSYSRSGAGMVRYRNGAFHRARRMSGEPNYASSVMTNVFGSRDSIHLGGVTLPSTLPRLVTREKRVTRARARHCSAGTATRSTSTVGTLLVLWSGLLSSEPRQTVERIGTDDKRPDQST